MTPFYLVMFALPVTIIATSIVLAQILKRRSR